MVKESAGIALNRTDWSKKEKKWSAGRKIQKNRRRGDGALLGKHTPGAIQFQHLNTR